MPLAKLQRPKTETEYPLPVRWTIKDIAEITGLSVIEVKMSKKGIHCLLENGLTFWIPKW